MRPSIIAGALLIAVGAVVLLRGMNVSSTHDVMRVGDVRVTDTDSTRIPSWLGVVGLVAGVAIVGAGVAKRN